MAKKPIQYTLRNVPKRVDEVLREQSSHYERSLNDSALEALRRGLSLTDDPPCFHDLDHLVGSWVEDPDFDEAMKDFEYVDPEVWR